MANEQKLTCPLCKNEEFDKEKGKIDSAWGITAHNVNINICKKCGYVLLFGKGRTFFDFD